VQAALTGHLVLATLHTNDAPSAVARLLDMDTKPYLLSGAISGVVAQRLVRTICPHCATNYYPSDDVLREAGLAETICRIGPDSGAEEAGAKAKGPRRTFRKGAGCRQCHDSGFQGRVGIYEVMEITSTLRQLIHRAAPTHEILAELRKHEWLTLRQEGVLLALDDVTSIEEVLRVTHGDADDGMKGVVRRDGARRVA
jgi:type II secretory ATPase GspE/PulE/Tfp pilus assembly ATPase PilB-like protein